MTTSGPVDRHTLEVLDFPRILELLAEGAQSPQGVDLCRALLPHSRRDEAEKALGEVALLAELEAKAGYPPTAGLRRIEGTLETARVEGACLDLEAFLEVRETVGACHQLLEYLEDAETEGSPLGEHAGQMAPLYDLGDRFERTFGPRGEILDGASPALQTLRADLRKLRERILKTLEGVLRSADLEPAVQDDFITRRGDRYVIPMRTDFRGYLDGIIHDRSRTGATFFVEPLAVVELNNQLSLLREDEEVEIRRILTELTRWVGREAPRILRNLAMAAFFDALGARLRLARRLGGTRPELVDPPCLELRGARHPLLQIQEGGRVVPVDVLLGGGTRLLLVTGANAGGKTVALKTAGLLTLMARAGLFLPADEGSRVGWFRDVYADIGDEQDIDRNLSTFSAHVSHLRDILDRAGDETLALLDELGTGTDPTEGAALAQAVLEALLDAGASVVATTHLASLKAFVYARPEAGNAAVAFDPASGQPLFRLIYGYAGASNALDVAERLGMPAAVLARARAFATAGSDAAAELLLGIERVKRNAVEAAEQAEALRAEWQRRLEEQEALLESARRERDSARGEAQRQARAVIDEARDELRRTIADFARRQTTQQAAEKAILERADRIEESLSPEVPEPLPGPAAAAEVGARVHVPSVGKQGIVETLDTDGGKATVRIGTLRVTVPLSELREGKLDARPKAPRPPAASVEAGGAAGTLVVVGSTVEEALGRVQKALDRAVLSGAAGFKVIHGRGTGALRRAIREYLGSEPHVRGVRPVAGDDAATWVDLD